MNDNLFKSSILRESSATGLCRDGGGVGPLSVLKVLYRLYNERDNIVNGWRECYNILIHLFYVIFMWLAQGGINSHPLLCTCIMNECHKNGIQLYVCSFFVLASFPMMTMTRRRTQTRFNGRWTFEKLFTCDVYTLPRELSHNLFHDLIFILSAKTCAAARPHWLILQNLWHRLNIMNI